MKRDAPGLARDLISGELPARRRAAEALAQRGQEAVVAAPALVLAAGDEDEVTREWAIAALENLGRPRVSDLPSIAEGLCDSAGETGYWAATLLGRSGTAAATCIGPLVEALQTRRETAVRERIVWALGRMGPAAAAASAAVESMARTPDCPPRLARLCREALQSMGPPSAGAPAVP